MNLLKLLPGIVCLCSFAAAQNLPCDKKASPETIRLYSNLKKLTGHRQDRPGEWVDIIGFDIYQRDKNNDAFIREMDKSLSVPEQLATEKNKIAALTEFGYGTIPDSTWFTKVLLPAIGVHKISYALAWRNAGKSPQGRYEFYVPYKGAASAPDFEQFYKDKRTLFGKDIAKESLYK